MAPPKNVVIGIVLAVVVLLIVIVIFSSTKASAKPVVSTAPVVLTGTVVKPGVTPSTTSMTPNVVSPSTAVGYWLNPGTCDQGTWVDQAPYPTLGSVTAVCPPSNLLKGFAIEPSGANSKLVATCVNAGVVTKVASPALMKPSMTVPEVRCPDSKFVKSISMENCPTGGVKTVAVCTTGTMTDPVTVYGACSQPSGLWPSVKNLFSTGTQTTKTGVVYPEKRGVSECTWRPANGIKTGTCGTKGRTMSVQCW